MADVNKNYAEALIGLLKKEELSSSLSLLRDFSSLLNEKEDLRKALLSYSVSKKEKNALIDSLFKGENKVIINFIKVLCSHHRLGNFELILREYSTLVCQKLDYFEGIVYSVSKLDKKELNAIEDAFTKKLGSKVELRNIVDPSLIGGIKTYVAGKVYDGSLSGRLNQLKSSLNGGSSL